MRVHEHLGKPFSPRDIPRDVFAQARQLWDGSQQRKGRHLEVDRLELLPNGTGKHMITYDTNPSSGRFVRVGKVTSHRIAKYHEDGSTIHQLMRMKGQLAE